MTEKKRNPLKAAPLRLPGQSLREYRDRYFENRFTTPVLYASMAVAFAFYEWLRWWLDWRPHPVPSSILAIIVVIWVVRNAIRDYSTYRAIKLGIQGEEVVGQTLEALRAIGYQVFHDIPGSRGNIDHALIGPGGLFTIETKTIRKKSRGNNEVEFDGQTLTVNGLLLDRDAVAQAKSQSVALAKAISASTGKTYSARPVILFPGWYVKQSTESRRDIWVLNEEAFAKFIAGRHAVLEDSDVALASFHLAAMLRAGFKL